MKWIEKEVGKLNHSCPPIAAGGLNCAFGVRADIGGRKFKMESDCAGISEPAAEGNTSNLIREFVKSNFMCIADAFFATGPACYKGSRAGNIDRVIMPAAALERRREIRSLPGLARRLQLIIGAR